MSAIMLSLIVLWTYLCSNGCTKLCALGSLLWCIWLLGFITTEFYCVSSHKSPSSVYQPVKRSRPLDVSGANKKVVHLLKKLAIAEEQNTNLRVKLTSTQEKLNTTEAKLSITEEKSKTSQNINSRQEQEHKILSGSAWAVWSDLPFVETTLSSVDISKVVSSSSSNIPIANHLWPTWIQSFWRKQMPDRVESEQASRPTIRFRTTVFGVPTISTDANSNHICPHSHECREYWIVYIRYIGGEDELGQPLTNQEARKVMNGVKSPALRGSSASHTTASRYSSLNRARPNVLSMKNGLAYYDRDPSVGILPIYQSSNMDGWISGGFEALVLAESAQQYVAIGATEIPGGKDIEFLIVLNSSVPGDLAKIRLAIDSAVRSALHSVLLFRSNTFPERRNPSGKDTCAGHKAGAGVSEAVPEHRSPTKDGTCERETRTDRSEGESSEPESESRECIIHEKYIREIHQSIEEAGRLWVPDSERIPGNLLFRVVRFGPADLSNAVPSADVHPAPIPHLLQQRNLDVLVNHVYKQNKFSKAPFTEGVFAAFWPSCLDLDTTGATCNLCRYHMSCDRSYGVELFASNEDDAVFRTGCR